MSTVAPVEQEELVTIENPFKSWNLIVWDDPINLMTYVERVFMTHFGYSRPKANRLMLEVHNHGKSVVAHGLREPMEAHALALQAYGLWATVQQGDA